MSRLISPSELKRSIPSNPFPVRARKTAQNILRRQDLRRAVLVGPCSIHDPTSALEYASKLKKLSIELEPSLFLIMRVFLEKPRSRFGWTGILYDPALDGSHQIEEGLRVSRTLLCELAKMEIPCATELLDPLAAYYFDDLIMWGLIGARTSASQPHRQLASRLDFPVGFKNDLQGHLEPAISSVLVSRQSHVHFGIDPSGYVCALKTQGNPWTHIVLRGSEQKPNFHPMDVETAFSSLKKHHLEPRLLIDCSHGNSGKDPQKQKKALFSVVEQAKTNPGIVGFMLESYLASGKQLLTKKPSILSYGVSVTDPCLSWEETEELLRFAAEELSPISMSGTQNGCSQLPTISPSSEMART